MSDAETPDDQSMTMVASGSDVPFLMTDGCPRCDQESGDELAERHDDASLYSELLSRYKPRREDTHVKCQNHWTRANGCGTVFDASTGEVIREDDS